MNPTKRSSFVVWHLLWFLPAVASLGYLFLQDLPRLAPMGQISIIRPGKMQPYTGRATVRFSPRNEQTVVLVGDPSIQRWNLSTNKVEYTLADILCPMLSSDGTTLLGLFFTATGSAEIYHWNTGSLQQRILLRTLTPREQTSVGNCPISLTSDGTKAMIWQNDQSREGGLALEVWQLTPQGGTRIQTLVTPQIDSAFFSPDGSRALLVAEAAYLWNLQAGTSTTLPLPLSSSDDIAAATFFPDNRHLVVQSKHHKAWIVDATQERPLIALHRSESEQIKAVLPLGNEGLHWLTYGIDYHTATIRRWNGVTVSYRTLLEEPAFFAETFALSLDNRHLAWGTRDGKMRIVDTTNGHAVGTWQAHDAPIVSMHFSNKAQALLSMDAEGVVRTWELPMGRLQFTTQTTPHRLNTLVLSPDGNQALGGSQDHLWFLDLARGQMLQRGTLAQDDEIVATTFPVAPASLAAITKNHCLYQWKAQQWHTVCDIVPQVGVLRAAAFSKDQRRIALADSNRLTLYETQQNIPLWSVQIPESAWLTAVVFSPDDRFVLTGNVHGDLYLWNTTPKADRGQPLLLGQQAGKIHALAISQDGKTGISTDSQGRITVWDLERKEVRAVLQAQGGSPIRSSAFSPDGKNIIGLLWSGTAQVWDVESGRSVFVVEEPNASLKTAVFSPDGQEIWTTCTRDATIRRWNIHARTRRWLWNPTKQFAPLGW